MSKKSSTAQKISESKNVLDTDVLDVLRQKVSTIQKLDIGYFTAIMALFGFLKIDRYEFFEIVTSAEPIFTTLFVIIVVDALIAHVVFKDWVASKINSSKRMSGNLILWLVSAQPLIHITFVILVISGYLAYYSGMAAFQKDFKRMALVQDYVEDFIDRKKQSPSSIEELKKILNQSQIGDIEREKFTYEKTGNKSYQMVFTLNDAKEGFIVTDQRKLSATKNKLKDDFTAKACFGN